MRAKSIWFLRWSISYENLTMQDEKWTVFWMHNFSNWSKKNVTYLSHTHRTWTIAIRPTLDECQEKNIPFYYLLYKKFPNRTYTHVIWQKSRISGSLLKNQKDFFNINTPLPKVKKKCLDRDLPTVKETNGRVIKSIFHKNMFEVS